MNPPKSISNPAPSGKEEPIDTAPSAPVETANPFEEGTPETASAAREAPADDEVSSKSPPKPMPQKTTATANATLGNPATSAKTAPAKPSTPAPPAEPPQPSLPVSMIVRPHSAASANGSAVFPGELEESFESALARVEPVRARSCFMTRIWGGIRGLISAGKASGREPIHLQRMVAFDGFHNDLFEDKRERDRRYGTVYSVSEQVNAFLVRLELPRRMPKSSLKQTWKLPDEMPDYACTITLTDNVLSIRAGLPDEARRRVSYVSSSFPSDFQTRIEFHTPVEGYKHRLRNKVLETIVFKKEGVSPARRSRR
jgi:hypothetical protein